MTQAEADRHFIEILLDFCRTHRAGGHVDPLLAQSALDWEVELTKTLGAWNPSGSRRLKLIHVDPLTFGLNEAPAVYSGMQPGYGELPAIALYTLTSDIEGYAEGSTLSAKTLRNAGYFVRHISVAPNQPRADQVDQGTESDATKPQD